MIAFGVSDRAENGAGRLAPSATRARKRGAPAWLCAVLGIPLEMKLLGANLIIMLGAVAMLFGPINLEPTRLGDALIVIAALVAGSVVNFVLVRIALRPINSLTQVAWLVSQGLLGARVPASIMADRELTQLSRTVNQLLDDVVAQRR
jgi:HAMP domain-containing protein